VLAGKDTKALLLKKRKFETRKTLIAERRAKKVRV
jgi:hypothetical protein